MDFLLLILAFLSLGAFIATFVGLIKPSLLRQQNRLQAFIKPFGAFIVFSIIFSALSPDAKQEVETKPATAITKANPIDPNNTNALNIDISKNAFLPESVQIFLKKDSSNFYVIEIDKSSLEEGFEWDNANKEWGNHTNWNVKATATFNKNNYSLEPVPECDGKCYVSLKVVELDKLHKRAVIRVSIKLLNSTKYIETKHLENKDIEIIGFDNLELEILNTNNKPLFNNLIWMKPNTAQHIEPKHILTANIKSEFNMFENMLSHTKARIQKLEEVVNTQPMGRGESGSLYVAKWNGDAKRWANKAEATISTSKLNELNYCFNSILKMKVVVGNFPLVGIGYIGESSKYEDNVMKETFYHSLSNAEVELAKCKESHMQQ